MITSKAVDPVAVGVAVVIGVAEVVFAFLVAVFLIRGNLMVAAAYATIVVFLSFQWVGWVQAASAVVSVGPDAVTRRGLFGWRVARSEVVSTSVTTLRGRPYLVVTPRSPRRSQSTLFLGDAVPAGALAAPLDPGAREEIEATLAS